MYVDSIDLAEDREVGGCCKHGNELWGFVKCGGLLFTSFSRKSVLHVVSFCLFVCLSN